VHSVTQFAMARFGLGIGESGNFPAGVKAVFTPGASTETVVDWVRANIPPRALG